MINDSTPYQIPEAPSRLKDFENSHSRGAALRLANTLLEELSTNPTEAFRAEVEQFLTACKRLNYQEVAPNGKGPDVSEALKNLRAALEKTRQVATARASTHEAVVAATV